MDARVYSWRAVPRRLGYLLPNLVLVLALGLPAIVLVAVGLPLVILAVGVPLLLAGLALARAHGTLDLTRLRAAGMPPLAPPTWAPDPTGGAGHRLWVMMRSADGWRYLLHALLSLVLVPVTWTLALVFAVLTLALPLQLVQLLVIPLIGTFREEDGSQTVGELLFDLMTPAERAQWRIGPHGLDLLMFSAATVIGLLLLPLVLGACVHTHQALAGALLTRTRADELRAEVTTLAGARKAATDAEGRALRRLERDLHDGPQQQLLRLQLDLESAQRHLTDDPPEAARLLDEARTRAAQTLTELRRLSRGIAPPLLQDRGLVAALEALAERNPVATRVVAADGATGLADLAPALADLDPALQQGVYFVVSELLANAVKHADATAIRIELARTDGPPARLRCVVTDDGRGGAAETPGGGLEGLAERVRGLGGTLTVSSPAGGPTAITALLPTA